MYTLGKCFSFSECSFLICKTQMGNISPGGVLISCKLTCDHVYEMPSSVNINIKKKLVLFPSPGFLPNTLPTPFRKVPFYVHKGAWESLSLSPSQYQLPRPAPCILIALGLGTRETHKILVDWLTRESAGSERLIELPQMGGHVLALELDSMSLEPCFLPLYHVDKDTNQHPKHR
jgi:hypothetical protein